MYTTCHRLKQVKQNSTNNLTLFFSTVFNALPGGVLHFAGCVAIKIQFLQRSWLFVENIQPISSRVLRCNAVSKTEHTTWKSIKNWAEKRCQGVCAILFDLLVVLTCDCLRTPWPTLTGNFADVVNMDQFYQKCTQNKPGFSRSGRRARGLQWSVVTWWTNPFFWSKTQRLPKRWWSNNSPAFTIAKVLPWWIDGNIARSGH